MKTIEEITLNVVHAHANGYIMIASAGEESTTVYAAGQQTLLDPQSEILGSLWAWPLIDSRWPKTKYMLQ